MQNGTVFRALGFLLESASAVVNVPALKTNATIGSKNIRAGKAPGFIQIVIDSLPEFAIFARGGCDRFATRVIKFINGTGAVRIHGHPYAHRFALARLHRLGQA